MSPTAQKIQEAFLAILGESLEESLKESLEECLEACLKPSPPATPPQGDPPAPRITHSDLLTDPVALPDDSVITFRLPHGTITVRHAGEYLEVRKSYGLGPQRLTIEPRVSNEIRLRIEWEGP